MTPNPVLVEALRGGIVESFHRGALAIVDGDGRLVQALGDIERPIFARSAVKVLQALPLVESGAAEALSLSDDELSIACASHGGQPIHAATAAGMLAKAGVDFEALECGAHWPYHEESARALAERGEQPSALHNNCSGKHAGFICLACRMAGSKDVAGFVRGYVRPEHPVMREVSAALQAATGFDLAKAARGTDGCSIPAFAIPLRHLAHAFAKVATGNGLREGHARAAKGLREAVARAPRLVAGDGRRDTQIMSLLGERVFCKVGAEAVYCAALPGRGLGVAMKMDDGNNARAVEVVMAALIEALVPLSEHEQRVLAGFSQFTLKNWRGIEVGSLRAAAVLRGPEWAA